MKLFRFAAILSLCSMLFFSSCEKNTPQPVGQTTCDTVYIHDTVITVPPTRVQILTQKDWIVDELYRNVGGTNTKYVRGGTNTTGVTYQNMRFHFNANGTGSYIDEVGTTHTLDWTFTSADQRNMNLNIGPPFATTFVWNMMEVAGNYLHATSAFSNGLLSARYIQVP